MTALTTRRSDYSVIALAFAGFVSLGLSDVALGVAWPFMRNRFGVTNDMVATLLIAGTLGFLLSSFNTGPLAARFGSGPLLLGGCLLIALGLVGIALAPSWTVVALFSFVRGVGGGALDAGTNAFVARNFNARVMNWLHAAWGLGTTLSPLVLSQFILHEDGWRVGYVVFALAHLTMALLFAASLRKLQTLSATPATTTAAKPIRHRRVTETLRLPVMWLGLMVFVSYVGIELVVGQWAFTLFKESRGIDSQTASFLVSLYWGSFTVGRLVYGMFLHELNPNKTLRICMAFALAGALVFWWSPVAAVGLIGLFVMGVAQAPIFPLLILGTPGRVGAGHAANAIGFQLGASSVGFALLPGLAGILSERYSLEIIPPFVLAFAVVMFVLHELTLMRQANHVLAETGAD